MKLKVKVRTLKPSGTTLCIAWAKVALSGTCGIWRFRTKSVMATAKTPSLNASIRPVPGFSSMLRSGWVGRFNALAH